MAKDQNLDNLNKELESIIPVKQEAKPDVKKAAPRKKAAIAKKKVVFTKGRRKMAIARASLIKGTGKMTVNSINIEAYTPKEFRELILEPANFSSATREIVNASDIKINVYGGGASGQAQAARTALAKAIAGASNTELVGKAFMKYDRSLLVDDVRQVEPKKFRGPKARARFQKSYR